MKKFIFSILFIFLTLIASSQDHPGKQVELLLNKELKVRTLKADQAVRGYKGFFTNPNLSYASIYKDNKKQATPYDELVGKIFKVTEITPVKDEYALKLENPETGTLYYKYYPQFASSFEFDVIGGLPTEFYCGKIETNSLGAQITPAVMGVMLRKETIAGKPTVMITAVVFGDKAEVDKKGMIITLENGKTIVKPNAPLDVTISNGYRYMASDSLTSAELKLLAESPIVRIRLFTFSEDFKDMGPVMHYAKCMMK